MLEPPHQGHPCLVIPAGADGQEVEFVDDVGEGGIQFAVVARFQRFSEHVRLWGSELERLREGIGSEFDMSCHVSV